MAEAIRRILYRSYAVSYGTARETETEIASILDLSRKNNQRDGLTGALLHSEETFTQLLEGPETAVEAAFERICCDLRHRRVQLLELTQSDERVFKGYSMALIDGTEATGVLTPLLPTGDDRGRKREVARSVVQTMRDRLDSRLRQCEAVDREESQSLPAHPTRGAAPGSRPAGPKMLPSLGDEDFRIVAASQDDNAATILLEHGATSFSPGVAKPMPDHVASAPISSPTPTWRFPVSIVRDDVRFL